MTESAISTGSIAFHRLRRGGARLSRRLAHQSGFTARVCVYDIKTDSPDPQVRAAKRADYAAAEVIGASTAPEAVTGAEAVFSVVTADQAHEAALATLPGLKKGALFFDCDSCAPQTKTRTAAEVDAAGGRYVDVAVMAPVHPRLHRTPLLISGPHAEAAAATLAALGMSARIHPGPVGAASAVKMIRSIMMKGLEALVCECVLAGRKAGVIETVLDSLDDTYPGFDWRKRSAYMLERVMTHGAPARRGNARGRADRRSARPQGRDVARLGILGANDRRTRLALDRSGGGRLRVLADRILAALDPAAREG